MTEHDVDRSQLHVDPDRAGCVTDGNVTAAIGQLSWFTVPDDLADVLGREPSSEEVAAFLGDTGLSPDALALLGRISKWPDEQIGGLDLCRLPVFSPPRAGKAQNLKQRASGAPDRRDTWTRCGQLNGVDVYVDGTLRMGRDEATLDFVARKFAITGYGDAALPVDLGELASFQTGRPLHQISTKDRWLAWESLDRLHRGRVRFQADTEHRPLGVAIHFISAMVDDAGPLRFDPKRKIPPSTFAGVVLDPVFVYLLRTGRFVWHLEQLGALRGNPRAMKLGRFFRGESFGASERKRFSAFEAEPGKQPKRARRTPAIADVLAYTWTQPGRAAKNRAAIIAGLREDCAYLTAHDPVFSAEVEEAKGRQMWNVVVWKKPPASPVDNAPALPNPPVAIAEPTGSDCRTHRYEPSDETHDCVQGKSDAGDGATSVLTSSSYVKSFKDTGFRGNPNENGQGQGRSLEDVPCTPAVIVARAAFGSDTEAMFADLFGDDADRVLEDLATAVCHQFRNASGGAVCREAAEHDDAGKVDYCPADDAFRGVVLKVTNYVAKNKLSPERAAAYVRGCIRRAAADPTELMGRTREDCKAVYAAMTAMNRAGCAARDRLRVNLKRID